MVAQVTETVETLGWSDRQLLLRTYYQACETNGTVNQLKQDVYGCPELEIIGLKQIAQENVAFRDKLRYTMRLAYVLGGTILASVFTMLGLLLRSHL